ncbi:MAG TPA: WYL domain-containing protein [Pseudomonadales bacterium]|nr:WYL domain-containing protein [Pseudomonadales bacterium]
MLDTARSPSQTQLERLFFIDFRAYFLGEIRRADITARFGVETAAASRDIALYRERGGKITLENSSKVYLPDADFVPLYTHSVNGVFTALSQGFGEGVHQQFHSLVPCEIPRQLNSPALAVIAAVSRAIHRKTVLQIEYHSFSSGHTTRDIVPLALANTGSRWHVRAYDRRRKRFTDFVLTRIKNPKELPEELVQEHEYLLNDIQWNRIVELEIVPHPASSHPEIIKMDYDMVDGRLEVKVRASLAGYFLRQWDVDCSSDHSRGPRSNGAEGNEAVRLWLKNYLALYGVETAKLAPGYKVPE